MTTLHIQRGIQFKPELFQASNKQDWLKAVGDVLAQKRLTLTLGDAANPVTVTNADELVAAVAQLSPAGVTAAYRQELLQLLDDVVKATSNVDAGTTLDARVGSELAKVLGLDDNKRGNYASTTTTPFGQAARTRPEGTLTVVGAMLQRLPAKPTIDLSAIPHMSAQTLQGAVAYGRSGSEVEAANMVGGLTKTEVVQLASRLDDIARPRAAAGLTLGMHDNINDMSWESAHHAARRQNPYVSLTLDQRSYEVSPNSGNPRVAIGRDFFFDTFFVAVNPKNNEVTLQLQDAGIMYRARIRYGSDRDETSGTRLLIGLKLATSIVNGIKENFKIDDRRDGPVIEQIKSIVDDAMTGKPQGWGFGTAPAAVQLHRAAMQAGITVDVGGENDVLILRPGACARQIRNRFHLNETDAGSVRAGFEQAQKRLDDLRPLIAAAADWGSVDGVSQTSLLKELDALLDRSAILADAKAALDARDPQHPADLATIDAAWPTAMPNDELGVDKQRIVAESMRKTYDAFAEKVDRLQRQIAGNTDRVTRDFGSGSDVRAFFVRQAAINRFVVQAQNNGSATPDAQVAYAKDILAKPERERADALRALGVSRDVLESLTLDQLTQPLDVLGYEQLMSDQTYASALAFMDRLLDKTNVEPQRDAWLTALKAALPNVARATDLEAALIALRKNVLAAQVEVMHRQIEAAGTWAQSVGFNNYREVMIGVRPQSWNMIIGSLDYVEFYDAKTGAEMQFDERVSRTALDPNKMHAAKISNDFQIELGSEQTYTRPIIQAQNDVVAAFSGLVLDYLASAPVTGLVVSDKSTVEAWLVSQAQTNKAALTQTLTAFAAQRGSPIDVAATLEATLAGVPERQLLRRFAAQTAAGVDTNDTNALSSWLQQQMNGSAKEAFMAALAKFAGSVKFAGTLSEDRIQNVDFRPFDASQVGLDAASVTSMMRRLLAAKAIWEQMQQVPTALAQARGEEVLRAARDANLRQATWTSPTVSKGEEAVRVVLGGV